MKVFSFVNFVILAFALFWTNPAPSELDSGLHEMVASRGIDDPTISVLSQFLIKESCDYFEENCGKLILAANGYDVVNLYIASFAVLANKGAIQRAQSTGEPVPENEVSAVCFGAISRWKCFWRSELQSSAQ